MSQTATDTAICEICGAEVRPGSVFCYNCGGSVKIAEPEPIAFPQANVSDADEKSLAVSPNGSSLDTVNSTESRNRDRSARRRPRTIERKPVEVVWEQRSGVSITFVVVSVLVIIIAGLLLFAANYLK